MRIIGLDLSVTGPHKAVVMGDDGEFLTPVFAVATRSAALQALLERARQDAAPTEPVWVVMEPTGNA